jgi:hypothetical protein
MNRTINYGGESLQNFTELEINIYILYKDIMYRNVYVLYIQYVYTLQQCFSTAGLPPGIGPGINYTGPREVLLQFVILVF